LRFLGHQTMCQLSATLLATSGPLKSCSTLARDGQVQTQVFARGRVVRAGPSLSTSQETTTPGFLMRRSLLDDPHTDKPGVADSVAPGPAARLNDDLGGSDAGSSGRARSDLIGPGGLPLLVMWPVDGGALGCCSRGFPVRGPGPSPCAALLQDLEEGSRGSGRYGLGFTKLPRPPRSRPRTRGASRRACRGHPPGREHRGRWRTTGLTKGRAAISRSFPVAVVRVPIQGVRSFHGPTSERDP
jgi:hypothetical protein